MRCISITRIFCACKKGKGNSSDTQTGSEIIILIRFVSLGSEVGKWHIWNNLAHSTPVDERPSLTEEQCACT